MLDLGSLIQADYVKTILSSGVGSFVNLVSNTFLVLLFMLFILAESGQLGAKIQKAYPSDVAARIVGVMDNISGQVRQYLAAKALVSALTGFLIFLILWILGVDFPVFLGIPRLPAQLYSQYRLAGSRGPPISAFIASIRYAYHSAAGPHSHAIGADHRGQCGRSTADGVQPEPESTAGFVSLIFWGWLWGIVGMVLAVPLTATIRYSVKILRDSGPLPC